ncbi:MAG: hypothetical protein JO301_08260 [Chitinophagaceae bacterium]|nr:hypothetical protein [Chitinophagaceae bacterium]
MKFIKPIVSAYAFILLLNIETTYAQNTGIPADKGIAVGVSMRTQTIDGKQAIRAVVDSNIAKPNSPTFVKINGIEFKNGTIEVRVLSRLTDPSSTTFRGFIGVAFRINNDNSKFEAIYIRPTNGRAEDQLRRNHATQYFSYPDYPFSRLRTESPGMYESYADMALGEWIQIKIVVHDSQAKLFLNDNSQPCLIVNDLKLGAAASGSVGLWVDFGTEGFFTDLKISPEK